MPPNQIKPSKSAYFFIFPFILIGVFSLYLIITGLFNIFSNMDKGNRFIIPGSKQIELGEVGSYTVFYEYQSVMDGKHFADRPDSLPALDFKITNLETGEKIEIDSSGSSTTYSYGSRHGISVFKFEVEETGEYYFEVAVKNEENTEEYVLNVEHEFGKKLAFGVLKIFGSIFGFFICMVGSVAVFLIVFFKRKNSTAQRKKINGVV